MTNTLAIMKQLLAVFIAFTALSVAGIAQAPRLLPFQGRLTDAQGHPVTDGTNLIQFKIYGESSGENELWAGEVHRVTVNGGLVNVLLGSKNPLPVDRSDNPARSFFDANLYLQITVDSDTNGIIDKADHPMSPRQVIVPVLFANESLNARKLQGYDWSVLFSNGNPVEGNISGSRLEPGSVGLSKLAPLPIGTDVGVGGVAVSAGSGTQDFVDTNVHPVANLTVSIVTSGRPVEVFLVGDETPGWGGEGVSFLHFYNDKSPSDSGRSDGFIIIDRDGSVVKRYLMGSARPLTSEHFPPSSIRFIDFPGPGKHTYSIHAHMVAKNANLHVFNVKLIAREW